MGGSGDAFAEGDGQATWVGVETEAEAEVGLGLGLGLGLDLFGVMQGAGLATALGLDLGMGQGQGEGEGRFLPEARQAGMQELDAEALRKGRLSMLMGLLAVVAMTCCSGFSSVYFEGILKPKTPGDKVESIWARNVQLAFFSLLFLLVVLWQETITHDGPYEPCKHWSGVAIAVGVLQAAGGMLVAMALKYTDSILKVLATSGSIVLSSVLGALLLGGEINLVVSLGITSTVLAIFNYTFD
jgi:UDP-galactose transporter